MHLSDSKSIGLSNTLSRFFLIPLFFINSFTGVALYCDSPAAVPVVTSVEAKQLNEDAQAFMQQEKEKKEPFHLFYEEYSKAVELLKVLNEYGFTPEQWTQRMNELIEDMNNIPIIF